ncbi:MAG: SurA N-terminal domain-containing protein [Rhodobiaceae bacterium]|nr:SurA N-terminal domain-containing protein [Rhodobiaceae bacterium]MCC0056503.1 SurA N-terminal domain-containing protein [Rhodobiaceae bacterium]
MFKKSTLALLAIVALAQMVPAILPMGQAHAAVRIVRLVNDQPITSLDVERRAKFVSVTQRKGMTNALRDSALEELTEEVLKRQEANRLGISVDSGEVDEAFAQVAKRVKMSPSQLITAFRQVGVDANTLKSRIEADLLWRDVVRQRFRQEVQIRDQDVEQAMASKETENRDATTTEIDLQQIVLILPKNPNNAQIAARKREAEEIRAGFSGCDAIRSSVEGHRDVVYKRLGRKLQGDLPENLRESILATEVGKLSPPIAVSDAVQMFAVCDKQEVKDDSAERREVQSEMMNEQGQILARRLLIDLRQSAVIENR